MKMMMENNEIDYDEENRLLRLYYAELDKERQNNILNNDVIRKVIIKLKGKLFARELFYNIYPEDSYTCRFRIQDSPIGKIIKSESNKKIKEYYFQQSPFGPDGDSYYGNISVEINPGKFIIMPFEI